MHSETKYHDTRNPIHYTKNEFKLYTQYIFTVQWDILHHMVLMFPYAFMFLYNGLSMTYTGRQKQIIDNKQLQTVSCVRLETALYIAVLHQWGCLI